MQASEEEEQEADDEDDDDDDEADPLASSEEEEASDAVKDTQASKAKQAVAGQKIKIKKEPQDSDEEEAAGQENRKEKRAKVKREQGDEAGEKKVKKEPGTGKKSTDYAAVLVFAGCWILHCFHPWACQLTVLCLQSPMTWSRDAPFSCAICRLTLLKKS
jgi:hypothetical protein